MNRTAVGLSRASMSWPQAIKEDVDGRDEPGHDGKSVVCSLNYDSRMSSNRRPSPFSNFFTALEAAISPWLA